MRRRRSCSRHRLRRIRPKARKDGREGDGGGAVRKERRKCPLRPLSSFEVHERLKRTKQRRSGYSLPFLLSRGVLPFPVEARTGEPLHGPFTITIIVDDGQSNGGGVTGRGGTTGRSLKIRQQIGDRRTAVSRPTLPPPLSDILVFFFYFFFFICKERPSTFLTSDVLVHPYSPQTISIKAWSYIRSRIRIWNKESSYRAIIPQDSKKTNSFFQINLSRIKG